MAENQATADAAVKPRGGLLVTYAALMLAILLAALDQTIVSTALPTRGRRLDPPGRRAGARHARQTGYRCARAGQVRIADRRGPDNRRVVAVRPLL